MSDSAGPTLLVALIWHRYVELRERAVSRVFGHEQSALTESDARSIFNPMIPQYLQTLFWDTNLENFDPLVFPTYTIGRILEYGNQDAIAWLKDTFPDTQIMDVVRTERRLSRRSANFWALVYGLSPDQVAALKLAS
jgi:hypothetical protein